MAVPFGKALAEALSASGRTQAVYAGQLGISQAQLSRVLAGKRRPPLRLLGRWLDALGVSGHERDQLELLACLSHTPQPVVSYIQKLHVRLETAELRLGDASVVITDCRVVEGAVRPEPRKPTRPTRK